MIKKISGKSFIGSVKVAKPRSMDFQDVAGRLNKIGIKVSTVPISNKSQSIIGRNNKTN